MGTKEESLVKQKVFIPKLFKVILHNDEITTMDFVVDVLKSIFLKTYDEAVDIMFKIHNQGSAVCGIYTKEVAMTKQFYVYQAATKAKFPLKCSVEEE